MDAQGGANSVVVDVKTAAPLFCAGVTAYHGIEDCGLKAGQWIAVIGCGGLGHLGIQYAKYVGLLCSSS
jgi:D-arabinose 1-dehydrogenase-like Zn-dependent alcohol dehydrogenase